MPPVGTVDVWLTRMSNPADAPSVCSKDERARAARRSSSSGGRWLYARGLLRTCLGTTLGVDPHTLRFCETPSGKPVLAGGIAVEFSLSHSGDLVAVAVAAGPVGIDIEVSRRLLRPEGIAARLIGDTAELARWSALAEPDRTWALLRRWTRTEAILKATGEGIAGGITDAVERLASRGWEVRDLAAGPGVAGAVAAAGTTWELHYVRPLDASASSPTAHRDHGGRSPSNS